MKFDLKNLNPGVWFTFPNQDGIEEAKLAKVCLRVASIEDIRDIKAKTTTKVVEHKLLRSKRGAPSAHTLIYDDKTPAQEKLEQEMLWDLAITDWQNLEDSKGVAIPCNKANKIALMSDSVEFAGFISDCLVTLAESGPPEDGPAKNLKPSQSG